MTANVTKKILTTNTGKWSLAYAQAPSAILQLYNSFPDNKLFFHNYTFSSELALLTEEIGKKLNLSPENLAKAGICAWFYTSGRLHDYTPFANHSYSLLQAFLIDNELSFEESNIYQESVKHLPDDPSWLQVLKDCIIASELGLVGGKDLELKKLQDDFNLPTEWISNEWEHFKMQQLLEARFITDQAKLKFEGPLAGKLTVQKSRIEKISGSDKTLQGTPKESLSNRRLQANIQNYIRVSFRNHIELTKMADNRAHIMISVNSILTGVLISYISYQNLPETQPKLLIPVIVFMITSLTSLIFAILCARPRTIRSITKQSNEKVIIDNIASFSNFTMLSQSQYEEAMDLVFKDNKLILGNLNKELYQTGKILDIKFKYLGFSYNIFMFGFVACVILFMAVFMLS